METNVIKEKLHRFVEQGDEKLLKMLYAVASEYSGEDDFIFTDADIEEFEKRRESRLTGASNTFTWAQAKQMIISK
jgi:hypothetical protein